MADEDAKSRAKTSGLGVAPATPGSNKIAPRDGKPDDKGSEKARKPSKKEGEEKAKREQAILARMRKRFERCSGAESENRKEMASDFKFLAGEQWDPKIIAERSADSRPCLTINKLPTFMHQVTNAMREQRPAMNVSPVGDKADPEAAKMWRGLIRHIERTSAAEIAYDTAFERAATAGLGYWRIITEFASPKTFQQRIRIVRVRNIFTAYLDPDRLEPDGADAKYGFITEMKPRSEFDEEYPDKDPVAWDMKGQGDDYKLWTTKDGIRIAEYFEIENEKRTLLLLSTGQEVFEDDLAPELKAKVDKGEIEIRRSRESLLPTVRWYKATAKQVLEEKEWVGTSIPIVPITGDEFDVEGKVKLAGIVRFAKDPQRMYNYWATKETEAIALVPNAPWVVEEGQIEGHESAWKQANKKPIPYLQYKGTSIGGNMAPPPQRQEFAGIPAGVVNAKQGAAQDMMATTGVRFDATVQDSLYDESGRALREHRRNGDIGSFHLTDNFARGLKRTGEIIIEIVPKVYDTKQILTILRDDDSEESVVLDPDAAKATSEIKDQQTGKIKRVFNPTIGKYGITVTIGPSYATKRIEAAESMMDFIRALPQTGEVLADLVAKNQDWPGSSEMATRLAKVIAQKFPGVMQPDMKDVPPQVQAMLTSMDAQIKQMSQERMQMLKALNDQQADRAQRQDEIDKTFEAKILKIVSDVETKTTQTQAAMQDTVITHIAALAQNVEKVLGHHVKLEIADRKTETKETAPASG